MNAESPAYSMEGGHGEEVFFDPRIATLQSETTPTENKQIVFEELYSDLYPRMYGCALHIMGSPHDAEDVTQIALGKLWTNNNAYRPTGSFSRWLSTVTRNSALDEKRKRKCRPVEYVEDDREFDRSPPPKPAFPDPVDAYERVEQREKLMEAASTLSPRQRCIIELMLQGMEDAKIAETLQINVTTVRTGIFKAVQRMRKKLSKEDFN